MNINFLKMSVTNRYGHFTDSPVDEAWVLKFNTLFLPTDHRKILNRQPEFSGLRCEINIFTGAIKFILDPVFPENGTMIRFNDWHVDKKVMAN